MAVKAFEAKEAQYHEAYLKATVMHANTLLVLDKADAAQVKKYKGYMASLDKSIEKAKGRVITTNKAANEEAAGKKSSAGMIIGIVIGVIAVIAIVVGIKKCKDNKDAEKGGD